MIYRVYYWEGPESDARFCCTVLFSGHEARKLAERTGGRMRMQFEGEPPRALDHAGWRYRVIGS